MSYELYCDDSFIKKGTKEAKLMDLEEFKKKIIGKFFDEEYGEYITISITNDPIIVKDLSGVKFDFENITVTPGEFVDNGGDLVGYHNIDGFSFLGFLAGGDWETAIYFIVYYDGENFRGYIPTAGNVFNIETKTAFGSEMENDAYFKGARGLDYMEEFEYAFEKHINFLKKYLNLSMIEEKALLLSEDEGFMLDDIQYDWEWLTKDIKDTFIIV